MTTYTPSSSENEYKIIIFKTENCAKKLVKGYITLGLDACIEKLKDQLGFNIPLIIRVIYLYREGNSPQVSYKIHNPFNGEVLDMSVCEGIKLSIVSNIKDFNELNISLISEFFNQEINIFDRQNPFFNDLCFLYRAYGKDVPLDDRLMLFYQNFSLCDTGCELESIDMKTYDFLCSCEFKNEEFNNDMKKPAQVEEMLNMIISTNIEVLKCYKNFINVKNHLDNYGSIMFLSFIIVEIFGLSRFFTDLKNMRNFIYKNYINKIKVNPPKKKIMDVIIGEEEEEIKGNKYNSFALRMIYFSESSYSFIHLLV